MPDLRPFELAALLSMAVVLSCSGTNGYRGCYAYGAGEEPRLLPRIVHVASLYVSSVTVVGGLCDVMPGTLPVPCRTIPLWHLHDGLLFGR